MPDNAWLRKPASRPPDMSYLNPNTRRLLETLRDIFASVLGKDVGMKLRLGIPMSFLFTVRRQTRLFPPNLPSPRDRGTVPELRRTP